jgi:hypothetical protein
LEGGGNEEEVKIGNEESGVKNSLLLEESEFCL